MMNLKKIAARVTGSVVLGAFIAAPAAYAQLPGQATMAGLPGTPQAPFTALGMNRTNSLAFASYQDRQTWHIVLVVSLVVLAIGLIDNDSTLAIIGAGGTIVSLVESGGMGFRQDQYRHGLDLATAGPLSFGINPNSMPYRMPGDERFRPGEYMGLSFKF